VANETNLGSCWGSPLVKAKIEPFDSVGGKTASQERLCGTDTYARNRKQTEGLGKQRVQTEHLEALYTKKKMARNPFFGASAI